MKKPLFAALAAVVGLSLAVAPGVHPQAHAVPIGGADAVLVSSTAVGEPANNEATEVAVSADGRFVAFVSKATNLAPVSAGVAYEQIYRKDLETGQVVLVSVNAAGQSANGHSGSPSISGDGSRVAFTSGATNLATGTITTTQVYVAEVGAAGGAMLISQRATGGPTWGSSWAPALSGDGTRVAFVSSAPDLVSGATAIGQQVYVATVAPTPHISFVSVSNRTSDLANDVVADPSISSDGSIVTFTSPATNLVSEAIPAHRSQIWLRNLSTSTTTLVSVDASGGGVDRNCGGSSISGDGSVVAYVEGSQIVRRDIARGVTDAVSVNRLGGPSNGSAFTPILSVDGSIVTFKSTASDLTVTSTRYSLGGNPQLYRRDLARGLTTAMSAIAHDPTQLVSPYITEYGMSSDSSTVVFGTQDSRVVDGLDRSVYPQLYARRMADPSIDRAGGIDRFAVAGGLSGATFGAQREVAYVATAADFPDALSASAAAGAGGGPVLLVTKDAIPTDTGAELARLRPDKIVIAGGTNSVSAAVEVALKKYSPEVARVSGADRFAVSAAMSASVFKTTPVATVYLASGLAFPDALGGAAATGGHGPVLLVTKDFVPELVRKELDRLKPSRIVVLGGVNAISDAVIATLPKSASVTRLGGADRFLVSALVSKETFSPRVGTVYVASGTTFPDALSGSAAAIADHAPMLLVTKDGIPGPIAAELTRLQPRRIVVLGGRAAVSDAVHNELASFVVG